MQSSLTGFRQPEAKGAANAMGGLRNGGLRELLSKLLLSRPLAMRRLQEGVMLIAFINLFIVSALFAAFFSAITALCTNSGSASLQYFGRFKAAYPSWLAAIIVLDLFYFYAGMKGQAPSSVPAILILALLVAGGWSALISVRRARKLVIKYKNVAKDFE